ncbi:hypothetical protein EOJ36_06590 [Sandaracinomonas limnophila]|uniref:Uncharacterized protein n=1 Tax=Sandaracinomonas limnophila TaxID=1862386 RepID=A0A437PR02_9BACT|nr:hypothetical protein [Sandaracinomonas limnophila]RVU24676.1 hypothetical protein EOJ36_06590 [Sandaracinomonas limnophila]
MNALKKILGIVWIGLGLFAGYYLIISQALPLWKTGGNDLVPAIIYTFILAPLITLGMSIFGYYAVTGEFNNEIK